MSYIFLIVQCEGISLSDSDEHKNNVQSFGILDENIYKSQFDVSERNAHIDYYEISKKHPLHGNHWTRIFKRTYIFIFGGYAIIISIINSSI